MYAASDRKYNIIVFGATGFTGKHIIEEILKTIKAGHSETFTWAVAGRSLEKLEETLNEVSKITGVELDAVDRIRADVSDLTSLEEMALQCEVLINAVGPYAKYGEPVIQACIKVGTHHVDLSAESHNLTEMEIRYLEKAEKAGVYVIGGCGFDSIPNDCGINFLQEKFEGDLNSVESYLYIGSNLWKNKVHYGSWTSVLHFYENFSKLRPLLRELYPDGLPSPKYKLKQKILHRNGAGDSGWCIPFPHPDLWAVERSQNYFYRLKKQRPVQFTAYLKQSNLALALLVGIGGLFLIVLLKCPGGASLLDRFPRLLSAGFASHEGPTRAEMEAFEFSFALIGKGWDQKLDQNSEEHANPPNKKIVLKISGVNPGYGTTCTCILQAALTIIREKNLLPSRGGVYTPGTAFLNTSIIERLNKHGLNFNFLE